MHCKPLYKPANVRQPVLLEVPQQALPLMIEKAGHRLNTLNK